VYDSLEYWISFTIFKQFPDWFGLPGPGEITILSNPFLIISGVLILSFL